MILHYVGLRVTRGQGTGFINVYVREILDICVLDWFLFFFGFYPVHAWS